MEGLRKELETREERWNKEKEELNQRIYQLEQRLELQDRKRKENNIVVKGLQVKDNNPKETVKEFIKQELKIKCTVKNASIIKGGDKGQMIVAELENRNEKTLIMKNKNVLKVKIYS